ncbi:MAG: lipid-A-disaccharide synthase [Burkholderiaceae bacterium]
MPVALVAGEASGDLLAGLLLGGLKKRIEGLAAYGIGGPRMVEQGFVADWPMEKLSVRGYVEVLRHYREIAAIRRVLRQRLIADPPRAFIGVDAPDFNLDLEIALRRRRIPTIQFVSPSIWAWRGERIHKIRQAVDHMLVLFPFEESIYQKAGIPATYVGHPLAEIIPDQPDRAGARAALGLAPDRPVLAVLPGSRLSEIRYIAPAFMRAAERVVQRHPELQVIVPLATNGTSELFRSMLRGAGLGRFAGSIVLGRSHETLAACDAALVASGTATLEAALYKRPMVIAYKMARLSWMKMRRMAYLPWVGLPNILAREFLVPELLQNAATPEALARALEVQLFDVANRLQLEERFAAMHQELRRDTARLAADAVASLVQHP